MKNLFLSLLIISGILLSNPSFAQEPELFSDWPPEAKRGWIADFYSQRLQEEINAQEGEIPNLTPVLEIIDFNRRWGLYSGQQVSNPANINPDPNKINDVYQAITDQHIANIARENDFQWWNKNVFSSIDWLAQKSIAAGDYAIPTGGAIALIGSLSVVGGVTMGLGVGAKLVGAGFQEKNRVWKEKVVEHLSEKYKDLNPALINFKLTDEERILMSQLGIGPFLKDTLQHVWSNPKELKTLNAFVGKYYDDLKLVHLKSDKADDFGFRQQDFMSAIENHPGGLTKMMYVANSSDLADPNAKAFRDGVFALAEGLRIKHDNQTEQILGNTAATLKISNDTQKGIADLTEKVARLPEETADKVVEKLADSLPKIIKTAINDDAGSKGVSEEANKRLGRIEEKTDKILEKLEAAEEEEKDPYPRAKTTGQLLKAGAAYANNLTPLMDYETAKTVNFVASLAVSTGEMLIGFGEMNPFMFLNGLTQFIGVFGQLKDQGPQFEEVAMDTLKTIVENQGKIRREMNNRFDNLGQDIAVLHRDMLYETYEIKNMVYQQTQLLVYEFDMVRRNFNEMFDVLNEMYLEIGRNNHDTQQTLQSIVNKLSLIMDYNVLTRISILYSLSETYKALQYDIREKELRVRGLEKIYPESREVADGGSALSEKSQNEMGEYNPAKLFMELEDCAVNGSCDAKVNGASLWEFEIDQGYFADDERNTLICKGFKLFLNNTSTIDAARSMLGGYPKIFGHIKALAQVQKTEEGIDGEKKSNATQEKTETKDNIKFENGVYPNLTLWEASAGLYLKVYDIIGRDSNDKIYNTARENQLTNIYGVTAKIDQFFLDTKDIDFLNKVKEAYKIKSEMIVEKLSEFIPDKQNSKWEKSWFNTKMQEGYEILNNAILTKGCKITMNLPDVLLKNETVQLAAGVGLISPAITINIVRESENQKDSEQQDISLDKYTIIYSVNLKNRKYTLNQPITQSFYLYNATDTPCTILETLIWGDEEKLRKQYEDAEKSAAKEYKDLNEQYESLLNKDTGRDAQEELNSIIRGDKYKAEIAAILAQNIRGVPEPVMQKKVHDFGLFKTEGDPSHIETPDSQRERDSIIAKNETERRTNEVEALRELRKQHEESRDAESKKARPLWIAAKNELRSKKTLLGFGFDNINNASGVVGIFGVRKELEKNISEYFSNDENKKKMDEFFNELGLETKDYILGEAIRKAMGIEGHLCDLDLIYLFLRRIITLSYNVVLGANDELNTSLENLMKSSDIIELINKWMRSKSFYKADISSLSSKAMNIENIYKILDKAAKEYRELVGAGITPRTGHYFYDDLKRILSILDGNQQNDLLLNQTTTLEPIEPLIEYTFIAKSPEEKFNALYDSQRKERRMILINIRGILNAELNKRDNPELVRELSVRLISQTDSARDFDLKQLGIEYFGETNPSPKQILELYNSQTDNKVKLEIVEQLFDFTEPFTLFALKTLVNSKEDLELRWGILNHLSAKSKSLIRLTYPMEEKEEYSSLNDRSIKTEIARSVMSELDLFKHFDCMADISGFKEAITGLIMPGTYNDADKIDSFIYKLRGVNIVNKYNEEGHKSCGLWFADLPHLYSTGLNLNELTTNYPNLLKELPKVKFLAMKLFAGEENWDWLRFQSLVRFIMMRDVLPAPIVKLMHLDKYDSNDLKKELNNQIAERPWFDPRSNTFTLSCVEVENFSDFFGKEISRGGIYALEIACKRLQKIPDFVYSLTELKSLRIEHSSLASLSEDIGKLKKLEHLIISDNKLVKLPDSIGDLESLEHLGLFNNSLQYLPDSIGNLQKLKDLDLSKNKLGKIPDTIGELRGLETLNLDSNKLTELPMSFGELEGLRSLDLSNNLLQYLPDEIGALRGLGELYLFNNKLIKIPDSIAALSKLYSLDLGNNQLEELPGTIANLLGLSVLKLYNNKITYLPDAIGYLINLRALDLTNNNLQELPTSICSLEALRDLYLGNNIENSRYNSYWDRRLYGRRWGDYDEREIDRIREADCQARIQASEASPYNNHIETLPECMGELTQLTELDLSSNPITELPESLGQLPALETLDLLGMDKLITLPDFIIGIRKLTSLSIGLQKIKQLPDFIGELTQLEHLSIDGNSLLKTLPESIGNLGNLKGLAIRNNNNLQKIPDGIGNLSELIYLAIDHNNNLSALPDSIGWLDNLSYLDISYNNKLEAIPGSIGNLSELEKLWIIHNARLTTLPDIFDNWAGRSDYLPNFPEVSLYENNFDTLPDSLAALRMVFICNNKKLNLSERLLNAEHVHIDYKCLKI